MNILKKPLFKVANPFTQDVHFVRVASWDRKRRVAHVWDAKGIKRTIPFSYFCWVKCGPS